MTNAERCRAYYAAHRAERLAKQAAYYEANRPSRLAYAAKYQQEHLEEHRQATERHRKKDPKATREYHRQYRAENRERLREQGRTKAHLLKDKQAEYQRTRRDPAKRAARSAVEAALNDGTLVKPNDCSRCHQPTPSRRLHGHHHRGYDYPLDVQWLCTLCHGTEHRKD